MISCRWMLRAPHAAECAACGEPRGNLDALGGVAGAEAAADGGHRTAGDRGSVAGEGEGVGDALAAQTVDGDLDVQEFFEAGGTEEFAGGRNARPADFAFVVVGDDAQAERPQQFVLRLLHINEKRREMHNPGGVGVAEFDATLGVEASAVRPSRATHSPTYGSSAMKRARLMASVTACWLAAVQPVLRRLTIRP